MNLFRPGHTRIHSSGTGNQGRDYTQMEDFSTRKPGTQGFTEVADELVAAESSTTVARESVNDEGERPEPGAHQYRVYKRRWFGLIQLVLLNIIVSWDVSTNPLKTRISFPPMSRSAFGRLEGDLTYIVAFILSCFNDSIRIFRSYRKCHQLA